MRTISFYSSRGKHGYLANFSPHAVTIDGERWQTVEHFFQAKKFEGVPEVVKAIRRARSPAAAKKIAKINSRLRRGDWEEVRQQVMRSAIRAKFQQHPELAAKLLATDHAEIVELAPDDDFWGTGTDGQGRNRMGRLLMELRGRIKKQMTQPGIHRKGGGVHVNTLRISRRSINP
jgi:N-glycosidase YbiA